MKRKHSNLLQLDPLVHCNGLLWVEDRLKNLTLDSQEKHPVILPKGHHVSELIISHFHENTHHQVRVIMSRAVHEAS